jgi:uncharacterized protein YqgC (DUF456 family)
MVAHKFLRPETGISWWGIAVVAVLLVLAYVVDFFSGALGTKWFGGSRWGVAGVLIGGVVGLFFGFIGLIVGPIIGGLVAELLFARKKMGPAVKATWGSVVGTTVGLVARIAISLAMIAVFGCVLVIRARRSTHGTPRSGPPCPHFAAAFRAASPQRFESFSRRQQRLNEGLVLEHGSACYLSERRTGRSPHTPHGRTGHS